MNAHTLARGETRGMTASVLRALALSSVLAACASHHVKSAPRAAALEEIYVLHSIREPRNTRAGACAASEVGFEPLAADAERFYSFWSVRTRSSNGRLVDTREKRVAELHGCFGATNERARQNFAASIRLGALSFSGRGECLALMTNFPEGGLFPVRCHLVLRDLPAPYVGGLLTTNTITSAMSFGDETEPRGYTQASIATIRLWKRRQPPPLASRGAIEAASH